MRNIVSAIIATLTLFAAAAFPQSVAIPQDPVKQEKKPGVIRIGIVAPMAEMGKDFSYADTPLAVRNTLEVALAGDNIETVFLESALPEKEAKLKKCDYVFYSKVTRKKGGGGFGGLGQLGGLAGMAGMIPGAGIAGAVAGAAASTAISVASVSGGFKSKDEVSYEYRLSAVDGTAIIPATVTKQKAKKNGDDVLTPQISAAADLVLAKLPKPEPQKP